jgi:magnesium transporter
MNQDQRVNGRETASHLATLDVPIFPARQRIEDVRTGLGAKEYAYSEEIYAVGERGEFLGRVPVSLLFAQPDHALLRDIVRPAVLKIAPDLDQELTALAAYRARAAAVPVVDEAGRLVGIVPPIALIDVLQHEHSEDVHRLAGIRYAARNSQAALTKTPWLRMQQRLPWLVVGLIGAMAMALSVAAFETALTAHIAVAFFMPAIVYLADAVGTQTEAVVVRGLSHGHLPLRQLLTGELATGSLIGLVLAALALPLGFWGFGNGPLAIAVSLAIVAASTVASAIGLVLPWTLSRFGFDPAYGSGPLATVIQDILSVLIYFLIVSALV